VASEDCRITMAASSIQRWAKQLKQHTLTVYFAARDPRTPWLVRLLALLVAAYALSPIDLIPDFIPVLGYLDDVLLLPGLIWVAIKLLPADVLAECRTQADEWMASKAAKPTSKVGAVVVVLLWLAACLGAWYWWKSGMTG